jgi:hypothetical protein
MEGNFSITAESLPRIMRDEDLRKAIEHQANEPEKFDTVANYVDALNNDEGTIIEHTQNQWLGKCTLRILVRENLPKTVAILRNGMLITERLPRLIRFGDMKDFVAVFQCESTEGQALLRGMEPPRHDTFEPERLSEAKRKDGRKALISIADWVKDMLKRHAKDPVTEETNLDEMADFFADEEEDGLKKAVEENPSGTVKIRLRPLKPKVASKILGPVKSFEETDQEAEDENETGRGEGVGTGTGC